jgi:hypothetical protein
MHLFFLHTAAVTRQKKRMDNYVCRQELIDIGHRSALMRPVECGQKAGQAENPVRLISGPGISS